MIQQLSPAAVACQLRCIIAEDHVMFGQMLATLLSSQFPITVVATTTTIADSCRAMEQWHPDLLILDLELADGNGLAVASHLLTIRPSARVIVLSGHAQTFVPPDALKSALTAVIDKAKAYEVIGAAVSAVLESASFSISDDPRWATLTPREREVVHRLGLGLSNKRLASELNLSVRTVETHRKHIAAKLGLSGAELVRVATLRRQQANLAIPPTP